VLDQLRSRVELERSDTAITISTFRSWNVFLFFAGTTFFLALGITRRTIDGTWVTAGALLAALVAGWMFTIPITVSIDPTRGVAGIERRLAPGLTIYRRVSLQKWAWVEVREFLFGARAIWQWPYRVAGEFDGKTKRLSTRLDRQQAEQVARWLRSARVEWVDHRQALRAASQQSQ